MSPGEKRRRKAKREREAAAYEAALAAVKATGATCSTCRHFGHMPQDKRRTCELDSDWEGYAVVAAGHVCPRHQSGS